MANVPVAVPNKRHLRYSDLDGALDRGAARGRLSKLKAWLTARETAFTGTGATQVFTAAASDIVTITTHGRLTGDGPFTVSSDTLLPDGLFADTQYFVQVLDPDTFYFHLTAKDAHNDTNRVNIIDAGLGVHTMIPDEREEGVVDVVRQGTSTNVIQAATDIDTLI